MKKEIFYLLPRLEINVEKIITRGTGCTYHSLDENYGLVLGWVDGFDVNERTIIHSKSEPSYGLVIGVKLLNHDQVSDYEDFDFPYLETGQVIAPERAIRPGENLTLLLEDILEEYDELINNYALVTKGGLIKENQK